MTDTKEPTPLNAEELAAVRGWKPLTAVRRWLSMSSYRKGKHSRYLATIDALERENERLGREVGPLITANEFLRAEVETLRRERGQLVGLAEQAAATLRELADLEGDEMDIDPNVIRSMARRTLKAMREVGGFDA